ncbi:glycosyl hydrolase, partial [Arthrobacter mobilis]|uniref:glycosyl hydrolase n=1 Tax=Arthrobacter mobilis TaxID=2724944 RepID=UPI001FEAF7EC
MERRKFLKGSLAAAAVPAALAAGGAVPAQAAVPALKGIGFPDREPLQRTQIKNLKVAWHYNWGANTHLTAPPFIPMVRDPIRLLERDAIGKVTAQLPQTGARHLLGFNEPDHRAQANMSVDEAIRLWPKLEQTGLRLGSPATVSVTSPWLKEFMAKAKARGLRVD